MEILIYYRHYEIFPSEYIENLVVTPLPSQIIKYEFIPKDNISELDISGDIDDNSIDRNTIIHPTRDEILLHNRIQKLAPKDTAQSGRALKKKAKYPEPSIQQLQVRFRNHSKKQRRRKCELLRSAELNIEEDYT